MTGADSTRLVPLSAPCALTTTDVRRSLTRPEWQAPAEDEEGEMTELTTFKQIEAVVKAFIEALKKQRKQSDYTLTD